MSNILDTVRDSSYMQTLKDILINKGCPLCGNEDLSDICDIIEDQMSCTCDPVVNAILAQGPGIKITPFDRKGYKISATDEALLSSDISERLPQGMTVHKALFDIVNKQIPCAMRRAAAAPAIVDIEIFRAEADGIDYYDNKAFPRKGQGRRAGLHPYNWYMRIYLFAQAEPMYIDLGMLVETIKSEAIARAKKNTMRMIDQAMTDHLRRYHNVFDDDSGCGCGGCGCGDDPINPEDPTDPDDPGTGGDPDEPGTGTGCGCGNCTGDNCDCDIDDIDFDQLINQGN